MKSNKTFVNRYIKVPYVICIDQNNENLGKLATNEALNLAQKANLDLVQINNPKNGIVTCKIVDYGKFKYENSKKEKQIAKRQRENRIKIKEIKFRPSTGINDLKVKAKNASRFLEEGDRVKVFVVFRGREMSFQRLAKDTLYQFVDLIPNAEFSAEPIMEGRALTVILIKKIEEKVKEAS